VQGADIEVPPPFLHNGSLTQFVASIYTNLPHRVGEFQLQPEQHLASYSDFLSQRSILALLNTSVSTINKFVNNAIPGQEVQLFSDDGIDGTLHSADPDIPTEVLHTIELSSWPPHDLCLKVGSVAIILRNLSAELRNGTRVVIMRLQHLCLKAAIVSGPHKGTIVLIPRIKFIDSNTESSLPQIMYRRQFPLKLCWAMTINKAQGQTLSKAWLYLTEQPFAHGQLYVALSRAVAPESIKILTNKRIGQSALATNIVWPELLLDGMHAPLPLAPPPPPPPRPPFQATTTTTARRRARPTEPRQQHRQEPVRPQDRPRSAEEIRMEQNEADRIYRQSRRGYVRGG
jgi:hypothetical protein